MLVLLLHLLHPLLLLFGHGNPTGTSGNKTKSFFTEKEPHLPPAMSVFRLYQDFRRQRLPSCIPHVRKRTLGVVVVALSFACIGLGTYILRVSGSVTTVTLPYSELCKHEECELTLSIPKPMKPPVFMFYALDGFYQNERAYVKSRSDRQLAGEVSRCAAHPPHAVQSAVQRPKGL